MCELFFLCTILAAVFCKTIPCGNFSSGVCWVPTKCYTNFKTYDNPAQIENSLELKLIYPFMLKRSRSYGLSRSNDSKRRHSFVPRARQHGEEPAVTGEITDQKDTNSNASMSRDGQGQR